MDPQTERMIRIDIRLRWSPFFVAVFIFASSVLGLGLLGLLAYLERFPRLHLLLH